jgi:3'-phosphoadenosine 5'-phosphosulfate sulfotransferase (PAPS reductase)/FAD synthetase
LSTVIDIGRQSLEIIELVCHQSKKCILFFSGGKDSVVVLHLLEKVYKKADIELVFMPFVEGLPETERVREMAIRLGYSGIHEYQHWRYFVDKAQGSFCVPQGKPKKLSDIYQEVRQDLGDLPIFYGAKRSDGMWRRLVTSHAKWMVNVHAPIYSWSKYDVLLYIRRNNLAYLKQEGDRISGVDLSEKYVLWAYKNSPESYLALKKEFPFLDVVIKKHEFFKEKHKNNAG